MVPVWQFGLVGVLAVALVTDIQSRKIYNWLTFPAMIVGLLLSVLFGGLAGLQSSGIGFLVGSAIFVVGFLVKGMGGGDVKLMAAIGIWLGWPAVVAAVVYVTAIGGAVALVAAAMAGNLTLLFKNIYWFFVGLVVPGGKPNFGQSAAKPVPYGVSIVLGTLLALFFPEPIDLIVALGL